MATDKLYLELLLENRKFQSELKESKTELEKFRKSAGKARTAAKNVFSKIGKGVAIGGVAALAAGASIAMAKLGRDSFNMSKDFEHAMKRVGALSQATAGEMSYLTRAAEKLGASTIYSASQVAEAQQFLAMAGFQANEVIVAMPGLLAAAAAGQVDLGRAADITSNILTGFGISAEETGRVADVLTKTFTTSNTTLEMLGDTMKYVGPVSKAVGVSLEETAAAAGLLGNAGIQGEKSGTALRNILLRLIDPPKEAADALHRLNVTIVDSKGELKPLADIIDEVNSVTNEMTKTQKGAIASQIAGTRAVSSFLALMDQGGDKIREYTRELKKSGGTAEKIAKEQNDDLEGSLKALASAYEGLSIEIGDIFNPTLKESADTVTELTRGLTLWLKQIRLLNTETGNLQLAGLEDKLKATGDTIAYYQARFGKYDAQGNVDMGGLTDRFSQNYSPALAKNYERLVKDRDEILQRIKHLREQEKKVNNVTKTDDVGTVSGSGSESKSEKEKLKAIKAQTKEFELQMKERLAITNYNALATLQIELDTAKKILAQYKEGTDEYRNQRVKVLEVEKKIQDEMQNIREDAERKEKDFADNLADAHIQIQNEILDVSQTFADAISRNLDGLLDGTKDFGDLMREVSREILKTFLNMAITGGASSLGQVFGGLMGKRGSSGAGSLTQLGGMVKNPGNLSGFPFTSSDELQEFKIPEGIFCEILSEVRLIRETVAGTDKELKRNTDLWKDMTREFVDWNSQLNNLFGRFFDLKSHTALPVPGQSSGGIFGNIIKGLGAFGGFFANGGTIPANKWSVVGERGMEVIPPMGTSRSVIPNHALGGETNQTFVYAPQVRTSVNKTELMSALRESSREFYGFVSEGVQANSGLRNSVRGA